MALSLACWWQWGVLAPEGDRGTLTLEAATRHCPSHKLLRDTNLQWQLLLLLMFHPCLPTAT